MQLRGMFEVLRNVKKSMKVSFRMKKPKSGVISNIVSFYIWFWKSCLTQLFCKLNCSSSFSRVFHSIDRELMQWKKHWMHLLFKKIIILLIFLPTKYSIPPYQLFHLLTFDVLRKIDPPTRSNHQQQKQLNNQPNDQVRTGWQNKMLILNSF